jgi:hypothetical protein
MTKLKTSYRLTGWNTDQLKLRVPAILTTYGQVLDAEFKEQIKLVQFFWPNTTYRRNGTIEFGPGNRDIVDLGGFIRSQRRTRPDATTLVFSWNAPYASLIFNGWTSSNKQTGQTTTWPARNWIQPALKAKPLDQFFAAYWQLYAKRKL